MSGFFANILSMLTGGLSAFFTNRTAGSAAGKLGNELSDTATQNNFGNWLAGATGSRLTDAQQQSNEFTAQQATLAWNRQMEADNTKYQRQVADMQAAGLNPILAAGAGASTPAASAGSSVSPGSVNLNPLAIVDLLSTLGLRKAQTENIKSDTEKKGSETVAQRLLNNYIEESERLRLEGQGLANELTSAQVKSVYKQMDLIDQDINLRLKQAKTEEEKAGLVFAQRIVQEATAQQIKELLPYMKALHSAQTEQARGAAAASFANAAYQKRLIDDGYITSMIRQMDANASNSEINADLLSFKRAVRTGDFNDIPNNIDGFKHPVQQLFRAITLSIDSLGGLLH